MYLGQVFKPISSSLLLLQQKRPGSGGGRAARGAEVTRPRAARRASSGIDVVEEEAEHTGDQLPAAPSALASTSGDSAAPSQAADVQHENWVAGVLSEVHMCGITGT
jgi:predicted trehalose synthase